MLRNYYDSFLTASLGQLKAIFQFIDLNPIFEEETQESSIWRIELKFYQFVWVLFEINVILRSRNDLAFFNIDDKNFESWRSTCNC